MAFVERLTTAGEAVQRVKVGNWVHVFNRETGDKYWVWVQPARVQTPALDNLRYAHLLMRGRVKLL